MNKYKVGDVVVCVKLYNNSVDDMDDEEDKDHLIIGNEYVIRYTAYDHYDSFPISVTGESGKDLYYREGNFELKSIFMRKNRNKVIENILE